MMQTGGIMLHDEIVQENLEKLEAIIDTEHIERTERLQKRAFSFEEVEHLPTVIGYPVDESEWPNFGFEEIFEDPAKMLLSQLKSVYIGAKLQDDRLYGIRPNYGTGIIASMFGCETKVFGHALPIALHVSEEKLEKILAEGVPDLNTGTFGKVLKTASYFRQTLKPYPKLSKAVGIELFDVQGTFDNASIIWGSDIYLAMLDTPDKVKKLIEIITQTIAAATKEFRSVTATPLDEQDGVWNSLGGICLRDDSCINLSSDHYLEFVKPFNTQLLKEFTGWIHFCGQAHQWWRHLMDIPNLKAINPYQGEFYDLGEMYEVCSAAKIPIVQWTVPVDKKNQKRIRTGFSRILNVDDYAQALKAKENLHTKGHAELD